MSVWCVPVWSVQLGAIFCIDPVFLVDEIMHEQTRNLVMLRLFPNISIMMEQIYVFKTSTTGYTHTHTENKWSFLSVCVCLHKLIHIRCITMQLFFLLNNIPKKFSILVMQTCHVFAAV